VGGTSPGNYYAPSYGRMLVFKVDGTVQLPEKVSYTPPELNLDEFEREDIGGHVSKIIVAGGSHAARLADVIGQARPNTVDLSTPGWKIGTTAVRELTQDLLDAVDREDLGNYVVIMQLFDNSIIRGRLPDGSVELAFKQDGKYHVRGALELAGQEELRELMNMTVPAFKAVQGANTFLVGPMARYLAGPCCGDPEHITNYSDPDYGEKLAAGVRQAGRFIRSLVWHKRWRNVRVINPTELMGAGTTGAMSDGELEVRLDDLVTLWGTDVVHPTRKAYENLAKNILLQAASIPAPLANRSGSGSSGERN